MAILNSNNFIIWSTEAENCNYAMPLVTGGLIEFFGNFALDNTVDPYTGLKWGLWSENLGIYLIIGGLNTITSHPSFAANEYRVYSNTWTIPSVPKNENFRFILFYEPSDIRYYSNAFRKVVSSDYVSKIRYKNSNDALGFLYETATSFRNRFIIDIWTGRPNYNENVKGYDTHEGDFIAVKSDIQKIIEFQTRFFGEVANEAFFSMLAQSEFYIDDIRYKKQQDQSYEITWSEDDDTKIGNGTVGLLVNDYSAAVINCN